MTFASIFRVFIASAIARNNCTLRPQDVTSTCGDRFTLPPDAALATFPVISVVWDALVSSSLYILGVGIVDAAAPAGGGAGAIRAAGLIPALDIPLLDAGGGTESVGPVLALLAGVGLVGAAWLVSQSWDVRLRTQLVAFGPLLLLLAYAVGITVLDALMTGSAPNYGAQKMGYMVAVVVATVTLPVALLAIDSRRTGMTLLRWAGVAAIALAMTADTLLPRGVSQLSSVFWAAPDPEDPPFWSSAEVKPVAEQPISSLPVACTFLPPGAEFPTGQPDAQKVYNCTRLLVGLGGLEGRVGGLMQWVSTDWLSNGSFWNEWYPSISGASDEAKARRVVILGTDGSVIGFETLGSLLERFPPARGFLEPGQGGQVDFGYSRIARSIEVGSHRGGRVGICQ
jgi:hypothetical protein